MPEQGWSDAAGDPAEAQEIRIPAFPAAPPLRPTPAPTAAVLPRAPLAHRAADRLRAVPWWVRFAVPAIAAFALVAGIGDLTKGDGPERTATAGTVAPTTTAEATTSTTATPTTTVATTGTTASATTGGPATTSRRQTTTTTAKAAPRATVPSAPAMTVPVTAPGLGDGDADTGPYYASCAEAKSAGAAPLLRGLPGYRASLDPDGDGFACED